MPDAILGLSGLLLAGVIALLLFIEEMGVPLFLVQGDLLLTVGGVAIAAGRLNAVLFSGLAVVTVVAGAACGREVFELLGWDRLMVLARRIRAEKAIDLAANLLRRNGWHGVFLARLIPGLRVATTQMAGVSRLPRHVFLLGVVPASAVYVIAFVGLGVALGRPALQLLHRGSQALLWPILFAAATVALILLLRRRLAQVVELLELEDWRATFRRRPSLAAMALVPLAVGLDSAGRALVQELGLPLFGDSVGTILVAVLEGPWVGGIAGLASNLVNSITIDPIAAPYALVSLGLGLAVGWAAGAARRGAVGLLALWALSVWVAVIVSTPINLLMHGGQTGVAMGDSLQVTLLSWQLPRTVSALVAELAIDLPDKLIAVVTALLIYWGLHLVRWRQTTSTGERPGAR